MEKLLEPFPKLSEVGESALLVELAEKLHPDINRLVFCIDQWLGEGLLQGVTHWVPGFTSLLIHFDPMQTDVERVREWLMERWSSCPQSLERKPAQVILPVRYGGEDGPDLENVAKLNHFSQSEVVQLHTEGVYRVGMMGFTPGFAYLMGLNSDLATPRLSSPRTHVPAGSVGIAGGQTGVYPLESPGGWQLIGRTDIAIYDPLHEPYFLLAPGDEVRFVIAEGSSVG